MASTKIINVLKDDKFEEILDLFKNTPAKEVIFVLPKTSKAFKKEEHFIKFQNEAKNTGKKISLLCSSPDTNKLAKKYQFDVLLTDSNDDKPSTKTVNQFDSGKVEERKLQNAKDSSRGDDEESEEEIEEAEKEEETKDTVPEETSPEFSPAIYREDDDEYQLVTISKMKRGIEGIVKQGGKNLKVDLQKERPTNLNINKKPTHQSIDDIKNIWQEQSERVSVSKDNIWAGINNVTKKSFRNFIRKLVITLGVVSVVLFGTIIYVTVGSAKIDITPHKQALDIQLKVSTSDKYSTINVATNQIPGQLFNIEKSVNQTFQTTGEKDVAQKARGIITVYNEYGTASQTLIATTRFQTSDGLIFRTLKGILVPGTTVVGGKIFPGSMKVEIIADKAGQTYNVPAGKFGIPAFNEKGDIVRYQKVYGQSVDAMKGGIIGKAKIVTDIDFNTARTTLTDQVTKNIKDSLKTQTAGLKVINDSEIKLQNPQSTAKIDEASDAFTMTVNGAIKTVGFKEDDLKNLIKQYVDKTQKLDVVPEKLTINYNNIVFDDTSNTLTFTVNIKGNSYAKVDADKIKTDLYGKNVVEIKNYFNGSVSIDMAKVVLSPFWVKRVPQDKKKIDFRINY